MSARNHVPHDDFHANAISFAHRHTHSEAFKALFREGMNLVEEAASYLDGPGRAASKVLRRPAALAYATESMRLTTRLMQIASWLLLRRAVNEGEITPAQAQTERHRVRLTIGAAARTRIVELVGEPAYRRLMEAPPLRPTPGGAFGVQELDADRLAAAGLGRLIASRLWFDKRLLAWARLAIAPVSEVPPAEAGHADEALEDLPTYFPEHAWLFGSPADRALSASSTA